MGLLDSINEHVRKLPGSEQAEVLDFVGFLESKNKAAVRREMDEWSSLSLEAAMAGLGDDSEEPDYSVDDLKESYR